jgi:phosphoribosylformylglycinamidine synthase
MTQIRALVLTGFGLNCDHETAYALELAGATAVRGHINALIDGDVDLAAFQILAFGGGFSWGDDHGAGVIQAVRLRTNLGRQLLDFVAADKLIIGICNGFQTLVNLGLLPAIAGDYQARTVALTYNDCGNFRDQWVDLQVDTASPCIFTSGISHLELPVRHGEGKFWAPQETLDRLASDHQIVLRYALPEGQAAEGAYPANPNGSLMDIAGICDPSGRIFGLMPHPEAYNHWTNHPDWTRQKAHGKATPRTLTPGVQIFRNAVQALT